MWIKTIDGDAVNMALIAHIAVQKYWKKNFAVEVTDANEKGVYIATFDSKTDAENYVAVLVEELNGNKPLGYAFSWLKSNAAKPAKPAETVNADDSHKDEILTDGLWF